ncbi:MAG: GNAT family N-acetyltransferase [Porticoccaceae bacterium]|nr:N-acetyltransferase [Pseudomonadales bacterium]
MAVIHEHDRQRFVTTLDGGEEAVLEYRLLSSNRIDFYRTYVPPVGRGQGHAEDLVKVGLAWARQQGMEVEASCWYVRAQL